LVYKIQISANNKQEASSLQEQFMLQHTINFPENWLTIGATAMNPAEFPHKDSSPSHEEKLFEILYTK